MSCVCFVCRAREFVGSVGWPLRAIARAGRCGTGGLLRAGVRCHRPTARVRKLVRVSTRA
eukprot:2419587-Prymnesium_polylepis.1